MNSGVQRIDAAGLECPEPVVRTRAVLDGLAPGTVVEVIVTDPMAETDLAVYCTRAGHTLLGVEQVGERKIVRIRRGD